MLLAGPLTGKGNLLQALFGGRIYGPWVKFTFYGYMVHLFVFTFYTSQLRANIYLNHGTIMMMYVGVIVTTLLIAVPLSTAFESPLMQIERLILFPPKKKSSRPEKEENFEQLVKEGNHKINESSVMTASHEAGESSISMKERKKYTTS